MNYYLEQFLESSTIHGLVYISTSRKFIRLFWILVVITGFSIASFLIKDAFDNWRESPIKTTIETRPIEELDFPKVTVCPPKNTFTDLNYDLMLLENKTMTKDMIDTFIGVASSYYLNSYFESTNFLNASFLSMIEEENRLFNWHNGYTQIIFPTVHQDYYSYTINTTATAGKIVTQYFGDNFDREKVVKSMGCWLVIFTPEHVKYNQNFTLTIEIERVFDPSSPNTEDLYLNSIGINNPPNILVKNFTAPGDYVDVWIERYFETRGNLETMPGYKIQWSYENKKVNPESKFYDDSNTKEFNRYL